MEDSAEVVTADALTAVPMESFSGCSSSGSGHEGGCGFFFEVAVERCPLCLRVQVPMFCATCVKTGKFSSSSCEAVPPVRFWDCHKHCLQLVEELKTNGERIELLRQKTRSFKDDVRVRKTRLCYLNDILKEKKILLERRKDLLLELRRQNRKIEENIRMFREKTKRRKARADDEKKKIVRRRLAMDRALRQLGDRRRVCVLHVARKIFSVDIHRPWVQVCGIPLPALTAANYHILDSSDRTVAALLYAAFFLRALLLILEMHLPRPLSTAMFGQDLVTRDDLVLLYRSLVYVVQRIFGHTEDKTQLNLNEPVLPQLVLVFRSSNLGRVGAFMQHRLQWLPTASLEIDETASSNADWVEVPWGIPYDAASTESQMHGTGATSTTRSFISSGAGLVSSWLGFAFGQSNYK